MGDGTEASREGGEEVVGGFPYLVSMVEHEDWLSLLAKCPESQRSALSTHTMQSLID
jgi:hypothetical protein